MIIKGKIHKNLISFHITVCIYNTVANISQKLQEFVITIMSQV